MNKKILAQMPQPWTFPFPDRELYTKEQLEQFAEKIIREYSYDVMNLTCMPDHVEMAARHWGVDL